AAGSMPSSASNTRLCRVRTSSRTSFNAFRPARSTLLALRGGVAGAAAAAVLRAAGRRFGDLLAALGIAGLCAAGAALHALLLGRVDERFLDAGHPFGQAARAFGQGVRDLQRDPREREREGERERQREGADRSGQVL